MPYLKGIGLNAMKFDETEKANTIYFCSLADAFCRTFRACTKSVGDSE